MNLGKGEVGADAPYTPVLDRLDKLCKEAGLSRAEYLDVARKYAARNEAAHHACVEPADHFDPNTRSVDWHAVKDAWEKVKKDFRRARSGLPPGGNLA